MSGRFLSGLRSHWVPWTVLVTASLLLVGSAAFAASGAWQSTTSPGTAAARPTTAGSAGAWPTAGQPTSYTVPSTAPGAARTAGRGGMMGSNGGGGSMMDTRSWLAGNGVQVTTIAAARARADLAAGPSGLHTGEVMQFSDNFYVELKDTSGASATEVMVDPATGAVFTEFGPAMMWTTGSVPYAVSSDRATAIANAWLQANAAGQTVGMTDVFPGHYTMDTVSGGNTVGMLSVNATTGAVWYHTWHGTFIAKEDA
jgi:hypothetical protein